MVHLGLYDSRSSCVKVLLGSSLIPDTPASSCMRSAKKSCVPGGGCICLVWKSYVACSCSVIVSALGLRGFFPYVGDGMREKASGVGGSRWGGVCDMAETSHLVGAVQMILGCDCEAVLCFDECVFDAH